MFSIWRANARFKHIEHIENKSAERPSIIIHDRISFSERNWAIHSKSCKTLIKHEWKHNTRLEIQKIPTHACNSRLYLVAATGNGGTVRHVYLLFIRSYSITHLFVVCNLIWLSTESCSNHALSVPSKLFFFLNFTVRK